MTSWLHEQRLDAVLSSLRATGARTVLDLGCGQGDLLIRLAREAHIERIVGIDLSLESLDLLRVRLGDLPSDIRKCVTLMQGSMIEPDPALTGFDAAVLVEAIEHVPPERLSALERAVFRDLRPAKVLITTPNRDYNPLLGVPERRFRHPDHRFEWGREKFRVWAEGVARRHQYFVSLSDLAGCHPRYGGPSQMGVFERAADTRGPLAA
jgi:3' terminal RNA ribose 2'-O-methyltransferase Hen1